MGFLDSIKRWKLVQQGMSSGKKRRTQSSGVVVGAVNRSPYFRAGLYIVFSVAMIFLVLNSIAESPFKSDQITASLFALIFSVIGFVIYELTQEEKAKGREVMLVFGGIFAHMILIQAVNWIPKGDLFDNNFRLLVLPYAFAPMIHSVLLGTRRGIYTTIMCTLFGCLMVPAATLMYFIVINFIVGLVVVLLTQNVRRRGSVLRAGLYAGLAVMIMGVFFQYIDLTELGFSDFEPWKQLGIKFIAAIATSILLSMIVNGVMPMLESLFGLTTNISWLELSDLNHKLLRKMQLEAPGTFHHSLVVASLAEAAAEAVGANATMCRVCAYFHDIGKLKKPEYFIENQGHVNPHDSLTPTMSALVIIAHVKDGVDLAMKYNLNPKIVEVIREHHGDSLVYYFYRKAQEKLSDNQKACDDKLENPEDLAQVDEKNFRYPGPTPSSKESGIISLADAIESASRTLKKPSPSKIKALVDDIVKSRMKDGQLDRCELSLKELTMVRESFCKSLRSMLHSRIDYPKEPQSRTKQPEKQEKSKEEKSTLQDTKPHVLVEE